jgi:Fic family protein
MTIDENQYPELHQDVTDRNLLRQYDFLEDRVKIALITRDFTVDHSLIWQLNFYGVVLLNDHAGQYRTGPVGITNSQHRPPPAREVPDLMEGMLRYLSTNWNNADASHLAAYTLWRMCWIHPFEQGNGRTARASCYLVLCLKHQLWLPGTQTIIKQITNNRDPYYEVLRHADDHFEANNGTSIDVSKTDAYLNDLLRKQLSS